MSEASGTLGRGGIIFPVAVGDEQYCSLSGSASFLDGYPGLRPSALPWALIFVAFSDKTISIKLSRDIPFLAFFL